MSCDEIEQEIRTAHRRREVTRLEGLLETARAMPYRSLRLEEAITDADAYLGGVRADCLRILKKGRKS